MVGRSLDPKAYSAGPEHFYGIRKYPVIVSIRLGGRPDDFSFHIELLQTETTHRISSVGFCLEERKRKKRTHLESLYMFTIIGFDIYVFTFF